MICNAVKIILELVIFVIGIFKPHTFENNDFFFWILFLGILWLLLYGADPLKKATEITAIHNDRTAIKVLSTSVPPLEMSSVERFVFATQKWVPTGQRTFPPRTAKPEELLKKLPGVLRYSAYFTKDIPELLERARTLGLEGLIGKRAGSRYEARQAHDFPNDERGQRERIGEGGAM